MVLASMGTNITKQEVLYAFKNLTKDHEQSYQIPRSSWPFIGCTEKGAVNKTMNIRPTKYKFFNR